MHFLDIANFYECILSAPLILLLVMVVSPLPDWTPFPAYFFAIESTFAVQNCRMVIYSLTHTNLL